MIDLPDDIVERTKVAAAKRHTSLDHLVIQGLEAVLREEPVAISPEVALTRLRSGYHLGGRPLSRGESHAR